MVGLIAPNGARVDVSEEKAERLLTQGYTAQDEKAAKPARRTRKAAPTTDDE